MPSVQNCADEAEFFPLPYEQAPSALGNVGFLA